MRVERRLRAARRRPHAARPALPSDTSTSAETQPSTSTSGPTHILLVFCTSTCTHTPATVKSAPFTPNVHRQPLLRSSDSLGTFLLGSPACKHRASAALQTRRRAGACTWLRAAAAAALVKLVNSRIASLYSVQIDHADCGSCWAAGIAFRLPPCACRSSRRVASSTKHDIRTLLRTLQRCRRPPARRAVRRESGRRRKCCRTRDAAARRSR